MIIAHIVAAAKNGTIGKNGLLPWHIPTDLKWFKERTKGAALLMGRKTFEAVEHPLPQRLNIVVTQQKDYEKQLRSTPEGLKKLSHPTAPVIIVNTIAEGFELCKKHAPEWNNEIFIIGGGEIYRQTFDLCNTLYITRIHKEYEGDAVYPDPDPKVFKISEKVDYNEEVPFTIQTWVRA